MATRWDNLPGLSDDVLDRAREDFQKGRKGRNVDSSKLTGGAKEAVREAGRRADNRNVGRAGAGQVMFELGVEHGLETVGLGQWPGTVEKLDAPVLPHIGWNNLEAAKGSKLFKDIEHERFYFVHSYGVKDWQLVVDGPLAAPKVTWADYGGKFIAAVENGPLSATQFHPEKSGQAGIKLLSNWLGTF
jgi:glutamine amidotransferase